MAKRQDSRRQPSGRWVWAGVLLLASGVNVGLACLGDPSSGEPAGGRPVPSPDGGGGDGEPGGADPVCPDSPPKLGALCPKTQLSRIDCSFETGTCLYQGSSYDEVTTYCCLEGGTWDICSETTTPCDSDPEGAGMEPVTPGSPDAAARGDAGDAQDVGGDGGDGGDADRDAPAPI